VGCELVAEALEQVRSQATRQLAPHCDLPLAIYMRTIEWICLNCARFCTSVSQRQQSVFRISDR
jgi:hypothetical protein